MELGRNIKFPIYNQDGSSFEGLSLTKATFDSVIMSLGDKITGDVYYKDSNLAVTMNEYIEYQSSENTQPIRYMLVNPPTIVREGLVSENGDARGMTKYSFEFVHPMYALSNMPFADVAVSNDELRYKSQDKTFSWIGHLSDFVNKLNKNLEETEWVCDISDQLTNQDRLEKLSDVLAFDNNTIADALKTCYETWDVPFVIDALPNSDSRYANGKRFLILFGLPTNEIYASPSAKQAGTPYIFRFGRGVGLKNNSANPKSNKIITRIAGYGSETNVPYGYPQIVWTGNQNWKYTINNDPNNPLSYPIYDGIVGGAYVKLIKHPFTRTHLMPSIYSQTVNRKVNPRAVGYNPNVEIKDYYDADNSDVYPNTINPISPSYEIHQFEDIKPELGEESILDAYPINDSNKQRADSWDDTMDDDGNYAQGYFKVKLPQLSFDVYACAAITQQMQINMRSGACIGCTFTVQVDWDDYRRNFYDNDGNFAPYGQQRDYGKFPNSAQSQIEIILQKDTETFGTLMPNVYQQPKNGDEFVILGISLPQSYIDAAEMKLDDAMKEYMLENNVYYFEYPLKFDEYFLATHTYILSQIKNNTIVRFEFKGQNIPLYVKQLTIKYGDKPLPEYSITLTDDVEIVLNQIGQVTDDVSRMRLQVSALQSYFDKNLISEINNKLSRTQDDTARGKITFQRGFEVGTFVADSTGASMSIDGNGATSLELDFLTVRRAAKFREITIQELKHIGGELALTAAAMECSKVETVSNGYKCYFETTDGDKTVYQEFVVGDQARCQQFALTDVGDGYKATKYYWRIVKEIGDDYIVLSNVAGEYDGDSIPSAGDKIVQLGYRKEFNNNVDIPYRTTAIILSATANDAPSTKYYEGITSFSLNGIVKNEGYSDGAFHSDVYGTAYIGAENRSSYVEYTPENGLNVNGVLQVGTTLNDGTDINNLSAANINLLLNSGFTGDFLSQDVDEQDVVDKKTETYSPSFKYWDYNNGCLIQASADSASGYQCYLSSIGVIRQTIENTQQTAYVVSIKAKGSDVTVQFGGVTKEFQLSENNMIYCTFKVNEPASGEFVVSTVGGCVFCEPMVAEGNVFETWSRSPFDNDSALGEVYAYSYLMNALSQASTTINKGLLLTQLIKVGNYRNGAMVQETGGMSGLVTDENNGMTNPFVWGGGTMEQAVYTIMKYNDDPSYQATEEEIAQMAKFVVTHGGRAILNDIVLRGYIYALGGYFRGEINATSGIFKNVQSPNGNFVIDDTGNLYVSNRGRIGGFYINNQSLTNMNVADGQSHFNTDAMVVFRNDPYGRFSGIGGNVAPAGSGLDGLVARFENENATSPTRTNYTINVSAKNALNNIAILMSGGSVAGLALNTLITDESGITISRDYNFVVVYGSGNITIKMPNLDNYDNGHTIIVKNICNAFINISANSHVFDHGNSAYNLSSNQSVRFVYCSGLTNSGINGVWVIT